MPELPEVEATRRYLLSADLVGKVVTGADVLWPGAIRGGPVEAFVLGITGRPILDIGRRAKHLLLRLGEGPNPSPATLAVHLRMTGGLLVAHGSEPRPEFTRNVILFDDGREIRFLDPRKLGTLRLVDDETELTADLGPEPLDPSFTPEVLASRLKGRSAPIKALLLDQSIVAGVGNIYADEALFAAGIRPTRAAKRLSRADHSALHAAIVDALSRAVEELAGLMPAGEPLAETSLGRNVLRVPRAAGQPCPRDGGEIRRQVIRGRSAYFCPRCQPR